MSSTSRFDVQMLDYTFTTIMLNYIILMWLIITMCKLLQEIIACWSLHFYLECRKIIKIDIINIIIIYIFHKFSDGVSFLEEINTLYHVCINSSKVTAKTFRILQIYIFQMLFFWSLYSSKNPKKINTKKEA